MAVWVGDMLDVFVACFPTQSSRIAACRLMPNDEASGRFTDFDGGIAPSVCNERSPSVPDVLDWLTTSSFPSTRLTHSLN